MPLIIAAIKLFIVLAGSILEFTRAMADIRDVVKTTFKSSKKHCHKAVKRGKAKFKELRRRKRDA